MIEIRNLKKSFGSNVILDDISFDIEKGDVIAVIGPSGTGKSTLLRCLNLLNNPDSGTIKFDDKTIDFSKMKKKDIYTVRKKSSMVFQSFNLLHKKTVLENVMEGLVIVKKLKKEEAKEIAIDSLKKVKMDDRLNYYPQHLSGGQQQRTAIARAIAMNPELLLFDEPTSALDPELVGEVLSVIQMLARENNTMVIVSHEMEFVRCVSNKLIFIENGKIVESGFTDQIFSAPRNERTKAFLIKNRVQVMPEYTI